MPRTGGIYNAPAGTKGIPDTTIQSAPYNALVDDLVQDANAARPVTAGGTGATNATDARTNIGALAAADLLAAPTKAVPVDNDGMVITDSEDSGKIKRVLWSVVKAKLQDFFDLRFFRKTLADGIEAGKFPPVNNDRIYIGDSADGWNGKITDLTSLRGLYKGYFDTVYQATLGFPPVQQGGGAGMGTNKLFIGWGPNGAMFQVDNTSFGNTWPISINGNANSVGGDTIGTINARIDTRAANFADDRKNQCVTDSRMAGEISAFIYIAGGQFNDLHNSGYVLTRVWHDAANSLNFSSRQPQLLIPNRGWYAAFNF